MSIDIVVVYVFAVSWVGLACIALYSQMRERQATAAMEEMRAANGALEEELQVDGGNRRLGSLMLARCGRQMLSARKGEGIGSEELINAAAHLLREAESAESHRRGAA